LKTWFVLCLSAKKWVSVLWIRVFWQIQINFEKNQWWKISWGYPFRFFRGFSLSYFFLCQIGNSLKMSLECIQYPLVISKPNIEFPIAHDQRVLVTLLVIFATFKSWKFPSMNFSEVANTLWHLPKIWESCWYLDTFTNVLKGCQKPVWYF
jgi:hypothetical protein